MEKIAEETLLNKYAARGFGDIMIKDQEIIKLPLLIIKATDLVDIWDLWPQCKECCFRFFIGLPPSIQIRFSYNEVKNYLPIFEFRWPNCSWPRKKIEDIGNWLMKKKVLPSLPDEDFPKRISQDQASFDFAIYYLISACQYTKKAFFNTTASVVNALAKIIQQRMFNIWVADDPMAIEAWRKRSKLVQQGEIEEEGAENDRLIELEKVTEILRHRNIGKNVACKAVFIREWSRLANLFKTEIPKGIKEKKYDEKDIDEFIIRWKNNAMEKL